jgi:hypothetical protein
VVDGHALQTFIQGRIRLPGPYLQHVCPLLDQKKKKKEKKKQTNKERIKKNDYFEGFYGFFTIAKKDKK